MSKSIAIEGYLTKPGQLREPRMSLNPGEPADLCVLKADFSFEKDSLNDEEPVAHTIVNGELLYSASSFKTS